MEQGKDEVAALRQEVENLRQCLNAQAVTIEEQKKRIADIGKELIEVRHSVPFGYHGFKNEFEEAQMFIQWLDARLTAVEHNPNIVPLDIWFLGRTQPIGLMMQDMHRRLDLSLEFKSEGEPPPKV